MKRFAPILLIALGTLLCGASIAQQRGCALPAIADWIPGGTAPIKASGFRVLITFNPSHQTEMPRSQQQIIDSYSIREYLNQRCAKSADGSAEWRIWPVGMRVESDQPVWQQAMSVPRGKDEWIVISDGRRGYSGELPADESATLTLLKKYGGA